MSIEGMFNHVVTVHRGTESIDDFGDKIAGFTPVATNQRARIAQPKDSLRDYGAGETAVGRVDGAMGADADIRQDDIIEAVEGPEAPRRFRVISASHPSAGGRLSRHHTEMILEPFERSI